MIVIIVGATGTIRSEDSKLAPAPHEILPVSYTPITLEPANLDCLYSRGVHQWNNDKQQYSTFPWLH